MTAGRTRRRRRAGGDRPQRPPAQRSRLRRAVLSLAVLALGLVIVVIGVVTTQLVHRDTEHRLLEQRTAEAGLVLQSAVTAVESPLTSAADLAERTTGSPDAFAAVVAHVVDAHQLVSVELYSAATGQRVAAVGPPTVLAGAGAAGVAAMVQRATAAPGLAVIDTLALPGRRLGWALSSPTKPAAWVVYAESALPPDPTRAPAATGPFQHLRYALYLGTAEAPPELLYATGGDLPLGGQRASTTVPFGDHQLLLVTRSDVTLGSATSKLLPSAIAIVGAVVAGAAALATDRLLRTRDEAQEAYAEQRRRSETLQRSLLPAGLPTIERLATATRYWPAERESEVGGDFFDVFPLDERRTAIVIGDVCGKGIDAAALTGLARHTIRAAARHVASPAEVLLWAHEAIEAHGIATYVTACFGIVSVHDDGAVGLELALGGHPPPILATAADGRAIRFGQPGTVLGLVPPRLTTSTTTLAPGDTLVLYTDGITDAAGDEAISDDELLATVAAHHEDSPDALAVALRRLIDDRRPDGSDDDVALLIVRVEPEPEAGAEPVLATGAQAGPG